jgi:hypothetical protein
VAKVYKVYNGVAPTTAVLVKVATTTNLLTLLQVKLKAGVLGRIVEWGFSGDGSALATPLQVELIEVDVAATVTAHAAAGVVKFNDPDLPAPDTTYFELGTAATGYTAGAEGTITASRLFDARQLLPTNDFSYQWPLDREPTLNAAKFGRIRVKAGASINAYCWMTVEVQ